VLTEAAGTPTGLAVGGASVHDLSLLRSTQSDAKMRVRGIDSGVKEHLCMDKGYDSASMRNMVQNLFDYIPHVLALGEEKKSVKKQSTTSPTMGR
jgi:putative transposase